VSEVRSLTPCFFDRYNAGQAPESAIDDCVEAWHCSGDEEVRPLSRFLGMTDDEYAVWVMDGRTLPLLRAARLAHERLDVAVRGYLDQLRATANPVNRAAIHALSHWLQRDRT
jgi:hypothetical protein